MFPVAIKYWRSSTDVVLYARTLGRPKFAHELELLQEVAGP
jgi:hypothetical protein